LGFEEIDPGRARWRQGRALGELSQVEGLRVPAGSCVTTDAFERIQAEAPSSTIGSIGCRA
jgi:phosphoenolpyruvate synthase/pyruvate phosphate dikinase